MEPFIVKHYSEDERPIIKGNGFDGLEIGEDREEAQAFVDFVNSCAVLNTIEKMQVLNLKEGDTLVICGLDAKVIRNI